MFAAVQKIHQSSRNRSHGATPRNAPPQRDRSPSPAPQMLQIL
ncbi:MAG: hypothetical protein ACO4CG_15250 [Prochlorothrix sp.]